MNKTRMSTILLSALLMLSCCLSLNVKASSFNDVSDNAYYADAVQWAVENNITYGMGDGSFGTDNTVTREQAVTFLWRAAGQPTPTTKVNSFTDVRSDGYSKDAILWAIENTVTEGIGDGKFNPDGPVTRGQMITFLWRVKGEPGKIAGEEWYEGAERWAQGKGILNGTAQKYSTNANCPRQDVVYYLYLEMNNTSGSSGGNSGDTPSGGNATSSREEEIKQREQELYGQYGGYEGYIDHLYNFYEGKYTKEQLKKVYPNEAYGSTGGKGNTTIH